MSGIEPNVLWGLQHARVSGPAPRLLFRRRSGMLARFARCRSQSLQSAGMPANQHDPERAHSWERPGGPGDRDGNHRPGGIAHVEAGPDQCRPPASVRCASAPIETIRARAVKVKQTRRGRWRWWQVGKKKKSRPATLVVVFGIKRVNRHADRRRDAMLVFARPNSLAEYRKHQLTEMVNHPSKTADQTRAERTGPQIAQGTRQGGRFHESTPAG